jgi:hypothetical protein
MRDVAVNESLAGLSRLPDHIALHSHMVDETPRLYFMHFWANDDAQKLAQGLRAALDLANLKRGS